jgi:adenylyltransferase/sulfurtransferase
MVSLDEAARQRYARQISLPELGEEGQKSLLESRVLLVGLGGLGSPVALYLAAAGVGRMTLVEFDQVDESNLHRQVLYATEDAGHPKLEVAAERLRALNPSISLELVDSPIDAENAIDLVRGHDVVVDGTDNFPARYAVNDACVLTRTANVHGAVQGFEGQVMVLGGDEAPCYRCLFPEPPPPGMVPSCAEAGVLGVLPGLVGMLQATETIKLLTGIGTPLVGRMIRLDALAGRFTEVQLARDPACRVCGPDAELAAPEAVAHDCAVEGEAEPAPVDELPFTIPLEELRERLGSASAPVVLDVRLPEELEFASLQADLLHIPLHLLPHRMDELDPRREYAVLCHHGVRSMQAVHFLRANGFPGARNLAGGIDRWSAAIDPSVPRY